MKSFLKEEMWNAQPCLHACWWEGRDHRTSSAALLVLLSPSSVLCLVLTSVPYSLPHLSSVSVTICICPPPPSLPCFSSLSFSLSPSVLPPLSHPTFPLSLCPSVSPFPFPPSLSFSPPHSLLYVFSFLTDFRSLVPLRVWPSLCCLWTLERIQAPR